MKEIDSNLTKYNVIG